MRPLHYLLPHEGGVRERGRGRYGVCKGNDVLDEIFAVILSPGTQSISELSERSVLFCKTNVVKCIAIMVQKSVQIHF